MDNLFIVVYSKEQGEIPEDRMVKILKMPDDWDFDKTSSLVNYMHYYYYRRDDYNILIERFSSFCREVDEVSFNVLHELKQNNTELSLELEEECEQLLLTAIQEGSD